MKDDDNASSEEIIRRICCSVNTFFVSNCCWGFLTAVMLAVGLVGVLLAATSMAVFPPEIYITMLVFAIYTFLIISMGCLGVCARVELCFILYIFFAVIGLLAQICGGAFLLLYTLDVAGYQDASATIVNGNNFLGTYFSDLAFNDQEAWVDIQNDMECCGITFEAGFFLINDANQLGLVESGDLCAENEEGDNSLSEFRADIATNEALTNLDDQGNIIGARDDDIFGIDQGFFCVSKASEILSSYLPAIITMIALLLLFQFSALVAAGRMYWVPEFLGGWALDEEALTDIAEHKGIKFVSPEGGYSGGRVLSTIRNTGARLSFRLQNAVTADPRVDPGAGFLKRLSTNRAVSFVGAGPSNPRPEEEEAENEDSGGRGNSVKSMLSIISKGFGRKPKSLIDTSGMGIKPPGMGVPKSAQAAAASTRNEEVNTQSRLLASFAEDEDNQQINTDSLNI